MAGHSKWKNIQHRKSAQDAKRGRLFMKMSKDIFTAAKEGGGDPDSNPALRTAIEKARAVNMPNENIERAIKKATGNLDGVSYEEITYEGYGPGGVAVMVDVLTDNKNRSASEIRHAFSKHGGNLGESGCVAFMFDKKGVITVAKNDVDEDQLMLDALEAGAEEMETEDDVYIITTEPEAYRAVRDALREKQYPVEDAELTMVPKTTASLSEEDAAKMEKLIDALESLDDVQDIYHNMN
ncbi:YebC/PmpR family DNA-binding transcriptional regulator [Caenibacillus caldisaponilyticus]|jgi:YebC/PmpR family DNA-binding regulatory protein|uniref:YebC/PmpR family DNA-binding transcriptional regulator n=1 Tax=Caenibacillus caldisaponilyticus TaxID=1674942 RepID=UPI00098851AB|nr:YebC/PmpR family DNA-binding transcriptional regulator [Caenibacillus caldisaponilyticus]